MALFGVASEAMVTRPVGLRPPSLLPSMLILTLRLIHILSGIFWLGSAAIAAYFLFPALRATGPSASPFMYQLMERQKLSVAVSVAMALSILSGFALYGWFSAVTHGEFARSRMAMVLGVGAILSIVAAGVAGAVSSPTSRKLRALSEQLQVAQRGGGAPPAEMVAELTRLRDKMSRAQSAIAALLILAASTMAIARYV